MPQLMLLPLLLDMVHSGKLVTVQHMQLGSAPLLYVRVESLHSAQQAAICRMAASSAGA